MVQISADIYVDPGDRWLGLFGFKGFAKQEHLTAKAPRCAKKSLYNLVLLLCFVVYGFAF